MNTSTRCTAIAAFALTAAAFGTSAASAADAVFDAPSRKVQYQDLDLNHEAGIRVLYRRIKVAAESVCAQLNGRQLIAQLRQTACEKDSIERAIKDVNTPMLTQYFLARNPKSQLNPALADRR